LLLLGTIGSQTVDLLLYYEQTTAKSSLRTNHSQIQIINCYRTFRARQVAPVRHLKSKLIVLFFFCFVYVNREHSI